MINVEETFVLDRKKESFSDEELKILDSMSVEEIEEMIAYSKNKAAYYNTRQNGEKLILNSIYGGFGNKFFVCSTKDIANAITIMARNTIKLMDEINEKYWYDYWHLDEEMHEMLGITKVEKIPDDFFHMKTTMEWGGAVKKVEVEDGIFQRVNPVSPYIDTDSLFVCFDQALERCNYDGDPQHFIEVLTHNRLEKLYAKELRKFAKKYNVENIQDFELENINESILFIAKKKYVKHTIWGDGIQFERLEHIEPKGVTLVQSSTPKFAREKLYYIIKYVFFDKPKEINIHKVAKFVSQYKKEFEISNIDDIAQGGKINDYWSAGMVSVEVKNKDGVVIDTKKIHAPGVVDDKDKLIVAKGTYHVRRAAALYNHLLYKEKELQNIYKFIDDGAVKYYPIDRSYHDMFEYLDTDKNPDSPPRFAYTAGEYPKEFAPNVDYNELYYTTFLKPLNGYLTVLDLPEINKKMRVTFSLFN